jgi:hypothetical protein
MSPPAAEAPPSLSHRDSGEHLLAQEEGDRRVVFEASRRASKDPPGTEG